MIGAVQRMRTCVRVHAKELEHRARDAQLIIPVT